MTIGLVGVVGLAGVRRLPHPPRQDPALATSWLELWMVGAQQSKASRHHGEREVAVCLVGTAVDVGRARRLGAEELLDRLGTVPGEIDLERVDGSFQIAVVDHTARVCQIYVDHMASLPLYYAGGADQLSFGGSCRALDLLPGAPAPRVDIRAAAGLLEFGYPAPGLTLREGIARAQPGALLTVSADGRHQVRSWWRPRYGCASQHDVGDAAREVKQLAHDAWTSMSGLGDRDQVLALTGGLDSRLLLGMMRESGHMPRCAVTWSYGQPPRSDPTVARQLAESLGVVHHVIEYAPADFVNRHQRSVTVTEAMNDNLSQYCLSIEAFDERIGRDSVVVLGEHNLGIASSAGSIDEVIGSVLKCKWPSPTRSAQELLTPSASQLAHESFAAACEGMLSSSQANSLPDIHHCLYHYFGMYGWLTSPTIYKPPQRSVIRPLASRQLVEASARWAATLKSEKQVLRTLLRDEYSDLARIPFADTPAVPDWDVALSTDPELRSTVQAMLRLGSEGPACQELFSAEALSSKVGESVGRISAGRKYRLAAAAVRVRRRLPVARALKRGVGSALRHGATGMLGTRDVPPARMLIRAALLAEFEANLGSHE